MTKIIAITNNKGGVAKTTTTLNMGVGLALHGYRVLLVDVDPQANLSISFGLQDNSQENLGNYLVGAIKWSEMLKTIDLDNSKTLDIAPAARQMEGIEKVLFSEAARETLLKRAFIKEKVRQSYDYVLIDCGPNLGIMTTNALCAADEFLIPYQAEFFSNKGTSTILEFAYKIKEAEINPNLEFGGLIITRYHENLRGKTMKEFVADIRNSPIGDRVYSTFIRTNVKLMESPIYGQSIFHYAPDSHGAQDYYNLVNEFLNKQNSHGTII